MTDEPENTEPDEDPLSGPFQPIEPPPVPLSELPFVHAAQSIALIDPSIDPALDEERVLNGLIDGLYNCAMREEIYETHRSETLLVTQARVLDQVFNRVLQNAKLDNMERLDEKRLATALQVQRQCRHAIETLKKSRLWRKNERILKTD